ncbi:MAG: PqiC family protein [Sulfitobacter sp.]
MMNLKLAICGAFCTLLIGCGTADRYTVPPPVVTQKIAIAFRSVEVRDVSLPSYAAADEIHQQDATGKLTSSSSVLWADSPERAVALELSRNLARLTSARVASEPWPFEAFPDARLEVRFENMVAGADGIFRISGQYFVGVEGGRRERSGLFELDVPLGPAGGPQAIAAARGQIILNLAEFIAQDGLR